MIRWKVPAQIKDKLILDEYVLTVLIMTQKPKPDLGSPFFFSLNHTNTKDINYYENRQSRGPTLSKTWHEVARPSDFIHFSSVKLTKGTCLDQMFVLMLDIFQIVLSFNLVSCILLKERSFCKLISKKSKWPFFFGELSFRWP